jgi:hypothetical protein
MKVHGIRPDYTKGVRDTRRRIYTCHVGGCERIGNKGFARRENLVRHMEKVHNLKTNMTAMTL